MFLSDHRKQRNKQKKNIIFLWDTIFIEPGYLGSLVITF